MTARERVASLALAIVSIVLFGWYCLERLDRADAAPGIGFAGWLAVGLSFLMLTWAVVECRIVGIDDGPWTVKRVVVRATGVALIMGAALLIAYLNDLHGRGEIPTRAQIIQAAADFLVGK